MQIDGNYGIHLHPEIHIKRFQLFVMRGVMCILFSFVPCQWFSEGSVLLGKRQGCVSNWLWTISGTVMRLF